MRGLSDKVVIVTGGGGGIGTATCQRFCQEGAKVAVFDIDADSAGRTAAQITEAGGEAKAKAFACDITDYAAGQRAVAAAETAIGPVDILVNNAGWDVFRPFVETAPSDWQNTISINLTGALNMHHAVLPGIALCGLQEGRAQSGQA
jgi:2-hydroxycyclohexanecarboxyl-CoA dehydrogenase